MSDQFVHRHNGPSTSDIQSMLRVINASSVDELIDQTVPAAIRLQQPLNLPQGMSEHAYLQHLRGIAAKNKLFKTYIGLGYYDTILPAVIQRNILENPGWYTAYTPYQAEVAQGRLEALLNYQTMVMDLTGMEIANASLLDEGTAAAEAMTMANGIRGADGKHRFFVSQECHPQTIDVVKTRAAARGIEVVVGDFRTFAFDGTVFGGLIQYTTTDGAVYDYREFCDRAHAAFFATRDEFKRQIPGRIIGVSRDADGKPALRMALQTREQHIRREKATSNVCTAQVLLAVIAGMYAVWHGPAGLTNIARRVHRYAAMLAAGLEQLGYGIAHAEFFDTIRVETGARKAQPLLDRALAKRINLRKLGETSIGIALDETVTEADLADLLAIFAGDKAAPDVAALGAAVDDRYDERFARTSPFLTHPVFSAHHSETEMLRYMRKLESRDLSLTHSMIPLGSCTMKLNATAEMIPITWPEFGKLHPFVPRDQAAGYTELFTRLEAALCEITGFAGMSLQPNAGSQGEDTGLMVIRRYQAARGEAHRTVCLIPHSAHGTNPASAVMAGMQVVVVDTDDNGNIDVADLEAKAREHAPNLAALMVTYPSTHGVFETAITDICRIVHEHGGQVYLDGANMNAMVGLARPGDIGADVCHLNLHKTFAIPHGGGGPGMGPIGVAKHLVPHLPGHVVVDTGSTGGAV